MSIFCWQAQNDVLTATLEESKSQAERLSVLIGKYESNNTALQLATTFFDHCIESQDVLTALLDTEMGVLLANCRAAGLGGLGKFFLKRDKAQIILSLAHQIFKFQCCRNNPSLLIFVPGFLSPFVYSLLDLLLISSFVLVYSFVIFLPAFICK